MKLHQKLLRITAAVLTAALVSAAPCTVSAEQAPPDAVGSVTVNKIATYYYDTPESGGMDAMWENAFKNKEATVKLYADWSPSDGICFTKGGVGTMFGGTLCIPTGSQITIDLNGFTIDRGLDASIDHGEVFYVASGAVLNVTDTSGGQSGKITGGYSTNTAGGIQVEAGGALNMWGGSISGNRTDDHGGGVCLAGSGCSLYMTGGSISENYAATNSGGLSASDSTIRVISGEISGNTTDGNGGGLYLSGGSADLAGCKISGNTAVQCGGGIYADENATLLLKTGTAIQKNKLVGLSDEETETPGFGAGVFMLSATPLRLSGSPSVSMNMNGAGTQSNLVFFAEEGRVYPEGRVQDDGVSSEARIGVSFTAASEKDYQHVFAMNWSDPRIFSADSAEFTILEQENGLILQRPKAMPGVWFFVAIGAGTALVLSVIAFFVLRAVNKKHKAKRRKKKKKVSA